MTADARAHSTTLRRLTVWVNGEPWVFEDADILLATVVLELDAQGTLKPWFALGLLPREGDQPRHERRFLAVTDQVEVRALPVAVKETHPLPRDAWDIPTGGSGAAVQVLADEKPLVRMAIDTPGILTVAIGVETISRKRGKAISAIAGLGVIA